jgi:hypothetical protein
LLRAAVIRLCSSSSASGRCASGVPRLRRIRPERKPRRRSACGCQRRLCAGGRVRAGASLLARVRGGRRRRVDMRVRIERGRGRRDRRLTRAHAVRAPAEIRRARLAARPGSCQPPTPDGCAVLSREEDDHPEPRGSSSSQRGPVPLSSPWLGDFGAHRSGTPPPGASRLRAAGRQCLRRADWRRNERRAATSS